MNDFLFAPPIWGPLTLIAVGIAVFVSGNKRQKIGPRNTGAGFVLLALVWIAVAHFVDTDKEKVTKQTKDLVHAVDAADWPKMATFMDAHASLGILSKTVYANRDLLVQGTQNSAEHYGLKSVVITSLEVEQTATIITANLDVLTSQDATMLRPVPSSWQLEWEQTDTGWELHRITCLKVGDKLGDLAGMFVR